MMHFLEHVALYIPLILLKIAKDDRNEQLEDMLPAANDKLYSTYIVNGLIGI
jgi:hypothetical protein